ncbi:hypothetical protein BGZ89_001617 [Linnemannia elongata]|nr:hypothetical protein BGZ89_001617 [Linnemannia elongata]
MRSHDQAESTLKPVRLAAKDPSTSHEFQVAHDEHGGMQQKDHPSPFLADAGARLEDSTPSAPSPLAAQGNAREHESSNHARNSVTSAKPNAVVLYEPPTTVSQPGEIAAPAPIHPAQVNIESAQSNPADSPHLLSPSKALVATSQDIIPAPTPKSATPQSSRSTSKKRTTWYGMEVPHNDDPLGPKKARPFSLGFGYKEHKKAALAAANASTRSPVMAGSPALSSVSSPLTVSSASANPASVQPLRPKVASNMAALRSHSFSPSQDRPAHIQETMHAPEHHMTAASNAVCVVPKNAAALYVAPSSTAPVSAPLTSASTASPLTRAPIVALSVAALMVAPTVAAPEPAVTTVTALDVAPSHPSPTASTAAVATSTPTAVLTTLTKPKAPKAHYLSKSGSFKERISSSPKFSKAFKNMPANMRRSHVPTGPVVMKTLPAPAEKLPGAFPNSPVVAPAGTPVVARLTTPSVVPVYSTPVASNESLPTIVRPVQPTAAAAPVHDSKAVVPAFSTPTLRNSDLPHIVAAPSVVSHPVVKESAPASKSTIATAATAVAAAAAGVLHKLSDHPESPIVTPGVKETVTTATVPAAKATTLPVKPSTAAALKTPKKDLSLYEEEESSYPRGDEAAKFENPAHPAVIEDVIEVKRLPKEFHSTAVGLKMPKKDLSLFDEEEGSYPRGDEDVKVENPALPAVVEDVIEVKKFPKATLAALAVPSVMTATLPEHHSTAAALKLPKKDLSLYDEEESDYPRGDEAEQHENPAHPSVVEEIVEVTAVPAEIKAIPVVVETKELNVSEPLADGTRRGSQSSMKEKVKGAFSGFHMPKMGRKKDEKDAEVEATTTSTMSVTDVKPAMAAAVAVPVAASIAAALRDTHDDEPFIEPPHHRLTSAPAVITEPLYHKPAAPLIDEDKSTSISARKLEPLSVLPPSGSVMVTDKATTTTEPVHSSHGVTSHPHVGAAAPVTIAAAAAAPIITATTTTMKATSERGTSTHHSTTAAAVEHPTAAAVEHQTVTSTLVNAAVGVIPVPVTPLVAASAAETHRHPTETEAHSTPISNSLKTKASHLAAAVAAPLVAAKDKITHRHDDPVTHNSTASTTTTTAVHPDTTTSHVTTAAPPRATTTSHATTPPTSKAAHMAATVAAPFVAAKDKITGHHHNLPETHDTTTTTTATHTTTSPTSKAAHLAAAVTAPLVAAKDKLTGHHHDDKTTHKTTPATAAVTGSGLHESRRASVEVPKEQTVVEKKVIGKAPEDVASTIPHNDDEEVIMVETITTRTVTTIPPTRTHVYEPGGAAAAAAAATVAHVEDPAEVAHTGKTNETHTAKHVAAKHIEVAKPVEIKHTEVKHEPGSTASVVAAVTGAASAVAAVFSGRRHSTVSNTGKSDVDKGQEVVHATAPHNTSEDVVMMRTKGTTTTTDVEPSHVHSTTSANMHAVKPVVETHVTKATETVAAAVPVSAAAVDSIIHPVDKHLAKATSVTTEETVIGKVPETVASSVPHKHDEDVVMVQSTTTTTEVSPAMDVKGKAKHDDHLPVVAAAVPVVVVETAPKPDVDITMVETKEAKKERKLKEKLAKKEAKKEAKKNQVPLKTKINKFTGAGLAAAAAAAVSYEDRLPVHSMPALHVTEEDVKKPSLPVVAAPLLTMTEDDVEKPQIPEVPEPIFTVTEDDIDVPYPVLTKHPVLTVTEDDVEYPSPLNAPHPVIPYVAPKLVSTSALKVASAPRPMIPAQPAQGKDIKLPRVTIPRIKAPKIKAPKMPKLKKKSPKVLTTAAAVVPEPKAVETATTMTKTTVVEPVKPVVVLEVPEPVVETVVETVVEPPKPVVEAPKTIVFDAPKVPKPAKIIEAPKFVLVEPLPKPVIVEAPKPKPAVIETVKPIEVPKPVVVKAPPKPVVVEAPPKPVVVETVKTVTTVVEEFTPHRAPVPVSVPVVAAAAVPTPAPAPAPTLAPVPVPVVVPTISTNVETVIPDGYSGAVPQIGADESLIWVKKVYTKNDYYDSEDEDELDEFGYRKDRDVSLYVTPGNKTGVRGGPGAVAFGGAARPVDYTLKNHTNLGLKNSSQPQQRTTLGGVKYLLLQSRLQDTKKGNHTIMFKMFSNWAKHA